MKPISAAGSVLDSEFTVEPYDGGPTLVLESRSGRARNRDYYQALELLLHRLKALNAIITDAIVDSTVSRGLEFERRRLHVRGRAYPIRLEGEEDLGDLRIAICAAQEPVAQQPGARGGNRHKRIRLFLAEVEEAGLETLLAGGGSRPDAQVEAAKEEIERLSRSGGQGRGLSAPQRRAVELRAMAEVSRRLTEEGWEVEDVSAEKRGYDLHVERDGVERHVEVKGTTGTGASVLLTPNEVRHCRDNPAHTVLAVVSGIMLSRRDGSWTAEGGVLRSFDRWRLDEGVLTPRSYEWVLPPE
jgi:Domain of unknown function (DUF3883)